jgi:uncharacterized Zn-binding protein involved in type VI secretion
MPLAARSLDPHVCSMHPIPDSPVSGVIAPRVPTVNIGFMPAAREGDPVMCVEGGKGTIIRGEPTVRIEGQPAARMGDPVGHQPGVPTGTVELGFPTVNIGSLNQVDALRRAADGGVVFCEVCAREGEP